MTVGLAEKTVATGDDVVVATEDAVLSAARTEGKDTVSSQTGESTESRAWDARARID